jgi:hypothetical protein
LLTRENRIAGYYTLSSTFILADDLPEEDIKKLKWPRYPQLPATLIGRLARDVAFRGQRIGDLLLLDALRRAFDNVGTVAWLAVIVDVKDENARRFYSKYGFLSFPDTQNRMYIPMKTLVTPSRLPLDAIWTLAQGFPICVAYLREQDAFLRGEVCQESLVPRRKSA